MNHLFLQTVEEITHMETNIVNLRDAKWEKDAPFKVAETRLGNRHQRPNVEMCRDEPSHRYEFAPTYLLLPLGKWGSKWCDFHLAMGVCV